MDTASSFCFADSALETKQRVITPAFIINIRAMTSCVAHQGKEPLSKGSGLKNVPYCTDRHAGPWIYVDVVFSSQVH